MNIITKSGFNFAFDQNSCKECEGNCCIGESGEVWIDEDEMKDISRLLNISLNKFKEEYIRYVGNKTSLKEFRYKDGYACCFFDIKSLKCEIYEYRPKQCRTFPFWDYVKNNIEEVKQECPGIVDI